MYRRIASELMPMKRVVRLMDPIFCRMVLQVCRKDPRLTIFSPNKCFIWDVQIRKEADVVRPDITYAAQQDRVSK